MEQPEPTRRLDVAVLADGPDDALDQLLPTGLRHADFAFCLRVVHRLHRNLLSRFSTAHPRNLQDGSRLLHDHYTGPSPGAPIIGVRQRE